MLPDNLRGPPFAYKRSVKFDAATTALPGRLPVKASASRRKEVIVRHLTVEWTEFQTSVKLVTKLTISPCANGKTRQDLLDRGRNIGSVGVGPLFIDWE